MFLREFVCFGVFGVIGLVSCFFFLFVCVCVFFVVFNREIVDGPTMRHQLCAHYVFKPFWGSTDGPTVGPPCAHYVLTVRPLCV